MHSDTISLWFVPERRSETKNDAYNLCFYLDPGTDDLAKRPSYAGNGHEELEAQIVNADFIRSVIMAVYPETQPPAGAIVGDFFREAIWQQIDLGRNALTSELYQKCLGTSSRKNSELGMGNGFEVEVRLNNRTHIHNDASHVVIAVRRDFWAADYGGLYDGFVKQELDITQLPAGGIVNAAYASEVHLRDQPYIQGGKLGMMGDVNEPAEELPDELLAYRIASTMPSAQIVTWFLKMATQPIDIQDTWVITT